MAQVEAWLQKVEQEISEDWTYDMLHTATPVVQQALTTGIAVGLQRLVSPRANGGHVASLVLTTGISQGISIVLSQLAGSMKVDAVTKQQKGLAAVWHLARTTSESTTAKLPTAVINRLKRLDYEIGEALQNRRLEVARTLIRRRQTILVASPVVVHDISHRHPSADRRAQRCIDSNVEHLLSGYPIKTRMKLAKLVKQMRANVYSQRPKRVQAYLQGPPGTGKTRFVRLLAEALQVPFYYVRLRDDRQIDLLFGTPHSFAFSDGNLSDKEVIGELAFAMLETGILNPIIFVDEAGALLSATRTHYGMANIVEILKSRLAPHMAELEGFGGAPSLDFSRATLIFAGNTNLTDAALLDRFPQIDFVSLDRSQKVAIAAQALDDSLMDGGVLSESQRADARAMAEPYLTRILDIDHRYRVPGARRLESAVSSLVDLVRESIFDGQTLREEDVVEAIDGTYGASHGLTGT